MYVPSVKPGTIAMTDAAGIPKNGGGPQPGQPFFSRLTITVFTGIAAVLVLFLIASAFPSFFSGPGNSSGACGDKVLRYVNQNLVQQGTPASLVSVSEDRGVYAVKILYQSGNLTLYATKDCSLLFLNTYSMNESEIAAAGTGRNTGTSGQAAPVKTTRPTVDLYVMAFCPYGTQAEGVMKPVVDLLGSKADIRVRYITSISGTTPDSIRSLHGPSEAQEDLRQVCIQHDYPEKFWTYLSMFDKSCYPQSGNVTVQDACQRNVSAQAGIDMTTIGACASGPEGLALLKTDEADSGKNQASGSPTLIINGVTYAGARTPEAYKQAICNSFVNAPAECNTTLPSQAANTAGGCG
jgi:Thioredoxin